MKRSTKELLRTTLGKPNKKELVELYWVNFWDVGQIALKYQVEPETVIEWIIKYDIPVRGYYETFQANFFYEGGVPAITAVTLQYQTPFDAQTTKVVLHFPEGCAGLVRASLQLSNGQTIFPKLGDYINLDGGTVEFDFVYFLKAGTLLQAYISNTDASNAHNVQVIVTIKRMSVVSVK